MAVPFGVHLTVDQILATPTRGASAAEFHPVRGKDRTLMDAVASAIYLRAHGCGMLWMDEPIPFAETEQEGNQSNDPVFAYQLARLYSTLWALAIFHNRFGQRGQLLGPVTRACAEQWVKGMKL